MSRTVFTDAGGFLETALRALWTNEGALDDTASSGINVSVTETLSASDAAGSAHSVGENASATDTVSSVKILHPVVSESGAATDTVTSIHYVAESLSATATQSLTITYHSTVAESGSATDHPSETYIATPTISESGNATDLATAGSVFQNVVAESGTAADTASETLTVHCAVAEAGSALDNQTLFLTFHRAVSESGTAADVEKVVHPVVESGSASDSVSSTITFNPTVHESGAATDTFSPIIGGIAGVSVHETLATTDTIILLGNFKHAGLTDSLHAVAIASASNNGVFNVFVGDTLHAADTIPSIPQRIFHLVAGDVLTAQDHERVPRHGVGGLIFDLSVSEALNAQDTVSQQAFLSAGLTFWGYEWAYVPGQTTKLAVWCAGLDCGDHIVKANGSVFVPWRSDPDGKFDPGWLLLRSTFPPPDGFGATACNIDLTTSTNLIIRFIVDLAIGLPYRSQVQLLAPDAPALTNSQYGPSLAQTRRLAQYGAQLSNAQGVSIGSTPDNLRPMDFRQPNGDKYPSYEMFNGIQWGQIDDDYGFESKMMAEITRPYPATIVALVGFLRTMDRE